MLFIIKFKLLTILFQDGIIMDVSNSFFNILKIDNNNSLSLRRVSRTIGIPVERLKNYNNTNTLPSGTDLQLICDTLNITSDELMLKMGIFDHRITSAIQQHADQIYRLIKHQTKNKESVKPAPSLVYETDLGKLYQGDCLELMRNMDSDSIDLIFADPPFNLNKLYPSKIDDNLKTGQYLQWCEEWAKECIRLLKPGGSFFIWNLPKWNTYMSHFLNKRLIFRHWISVDIKYTLPIRGRLYPSHYSLLYYCKGKKPARFHPDRLPMEICPHCVGDLKDYGGYKDKMNPKGVNLTDVWFDIPPVRHAKYKKSNDSNELSIKLLDRVIEMTSDEGDTVFDPFGGSGTTYAIAELKKRKWIGIEIGPADGIIDRFKKIYNDASYLKEIRENLNCLFTEKTLQRRWENGLWTSETVRRKRIK
jgi:site-specific DNA-methyltransferase (adenine-specific)